MQVIEIVTFKTKPGISQEDFLAIDTVALKDVEKLNGFLYRSLAFNKESAIWTDIIYWESAEAAKLGEAEFMKSEACQEVMAAVEKESTVMQLSDILYSSCNETEAENCG